MPWLQRADQHITPGLGMESPEGSKFRFCLLQLLSPLTVLGCIFVPGEFQNDYKVSFLIHPYPSVKLNLKLEKQVGQI